MRPLKTFSLLSLIFACLLLQTTARADDTDGTDGNEYDEHARVMRVSLLKGEVSLQRSGSLEWEHAKLNLPLVEGDTLATGQDARLELQIDARNFVRVGENSVLKVITLRDEGVALSLSEGTATVRLARFDHEHEYFEIDAPKTTIAAEQRGLYRLDVARDGSVRVSVRDDGRARLYSESSGFVLRSNKTARLTYAGDADGDWDLTSAASLDEWDNWNDERERDLASRLHYEERERYYDAEVFGAEELDAYGDWENTRQYGYVWRPRMAVINNYNDWAPYRYGHWSWCPPYGWTWVADEEWGWAPYHYGRWIYYNNNWCWAPRGYGYTYHHAWWRPALVAFIYVPTSFGEHVAWYPLTYGQRDPRGRYYPRGDDRRWPQRGNEIGNFHRTHPAFLRAVTTARARDFGVDSLRPRAAPTDIAQRALTGEPVRGRLPISPTDAGRVATPGMAPGTGRNNPTGAHRTNADGRAGLNITRPAPVLPPRNIPQRPTGAATRAPGVALDEPLRRERIFNNREPRAPSPSRVNGGERTNDEGMGAVTRPAVRPGRRAPNDGGGTVENRNNDGSAPSTRTRPVTTPPTTSVDGSAREDKNDRPVHTPGSRDRDDGTLRVRPVRPLNDDRPASPSPTINERPEPRVRRPEPEERAQPQPRREEPPPVRPERHREEQTPPPAREQQPPARVERSSPPPERTAPSAPQPTHHDAPREHHEQVRPPAARAQRD